MSDEGATIVPWTSPEETWRELVAGGHAPTTPLGVRVCGQHVECLSNDVGFRPCAVQGCRHGWPFEDVLPLMPEIFDNLAVYLPLHAYGPSSWGVWLHAERITAYAERIARVCDSTYARDDLFDIVARHAQFHHVVEAAITATQLAPSTSLCRFAPECFGHAVGAPESREELLANAWAFRTALGGVERRTLDTVMQQVRTHAPPGYANFDEATESEPFAVTEIELIRPHVAGDFDFVPPSEHGRAAEIPVYLWGSEAARRAVSPSARNAFLGPLIGRARYAGRPADSVSDEQRAMLVERCALLKVLGEDDLFPMLFDELDFDTIAGLRSGLIDWARGAQTMAELDPIVREIGAFERATRWETMEDVVRARTV